ncbi:MAG: DNA primase [Terriglobales bacterium]
MSEFSDQLKARADLGQLVGEVVALKPGGNGFVGLCPFHAEKTPSFHIHTGKRFYYCFGCHAHGDVYQFYMQLRSISFPEAVALVAERMGVPLPQDAAAADPRRRELLRIHATAADCFARWLDGRAGAAARAYLQSRDFNPGQLESFHLGYAPEDGRSLTRALEAQGFPTALALESGLCQLRRESASASAGASPAWPDLYDRFRHRLMFPIADERGKVIAFGGRALEPSDRVPKYLNSPEHPLYSKGRVVYNLDRARTPIRELGYAILVEGYFDCLRVFLEGFHNVVSSCGTALTQSQVSALGHVNKKMVVNFDPDTAGGAAAERSVTLLLEEGFHMRVAVLEPGLDPDLFVRQRGREAYAQALTSSRSFFDYLLDRARAQFELSRPEGKLQAVNYLLPFINHVHEPILRQGLAENLAAQLGLEQSLLSRQLVQAASQRRPQLSQPAAAQPSLYAERVLVRAWVEQEGRREEIAALVRNESLLQGLGSEALFENLCQAPLGSDWQELSANLPQAQQFWLAQITLGSGGDGTAALDPPLGEQSLADAVASLRRRQAACTRHHLQEQIAQAAARGDRPQLETLLRAKAAADAAARAAS